MRKRIKKRRSQEEVELNLAAMLDMAFQLLAFFVLIYKPMPVEGQISLRMPPPQATRVVADGQQAGQDYNNTNPIQGVNTLTISVLANPKTGSISGLGVGEAQVQGLSELESRLKTVFADEGNPFDQVIIQVSDSCRYDELMKVIEVCTRLKLPTGKPLSKLSFVGLPDS